MYYRPRPDYFVWIEIAGILGLAALLLGPPAYLVASAVGGGGGPSGAVASGGGSGPQAPAREPAVRSEGTTPVPGLSTGPVGRASTVESRSSGRSGEAAAPFSDGWRSEATPGLSGSVGSGGAGSSSPALTPGPSGAPDGTFRFGDGSGSGLGDGPDAGASGGLDGSFSGGGSALAVRGGGDADGGPSVGDPTASDPAAGSRARGAVDRDAADPGTGTRTATRQEAEQLAGRMRALSGQLQQMDQPGAETSTSEKQADSGPGSPDEPDRREPGSPENVPIGDHLHWLAALGVLWGAWRIWRGA